MPTVSGVKESLQTMPIALPPNKNKKNVAGFYEMTTIHGNVGADGGLAIILGATAPSPLLVSSLLESRYILSFVLF